MAGTPNMTNTGHYTGIKAMIKKSEHPKIYKKHRPLITTKSNSFQTGGKF